MNKKPYSKNNKCNCGKLITNNAVRCHCCATRLLHKENILNSKGENNPMYGKHNKNSGNYKHGLNCDNKPKCKCGKLITINTVKYGKKKCKVCSKIGIKPNNKTRVKMSIIRGGTGIPYSDRVHPKEFYYIRGTIIKRDKYKCQLCLKSGNTVHHIDYNKQNNKESNLINLCKGCNGKVNFNRDYWYAYFTYIMENR